MHNASHLTIRTPFFQMMPSVMSSALLFYHIMRAVITSHFCPADTACCHTLCQWRLVLHQGGRRETNHPTGSGGRRPCAPNVAAATALCTPLLYLLPAVMPSTFHLCKNFHHMPSLHSHTYFSWRYPQHFSPVHIAQKQLA